MVKKLVILITVSFSAPIMSMNPTERQWMDRNYAGTEAHIEHSPRCRLFAIDDTICNDQVTIKKMTYKNTTCIILTPHAHQTNLNARVIPTDENSKMILSEDRLYLLVGESSKEFALNKIVRIYDMKTGNEVYSYCGGFSDILDMKLVHDGVHYVLTIAGHDILTNKSKHGTYDIDPFFINMTHQIIRV